MTVRGDDDDLDRCDVVVTPACVPALYGIPEPDQDDAAVSPNNTLGICESESYFYQADLDLFFANHKQATTQETKPTWTSKHHTPSFTRNK